MKTSWFLTAVAVSALCGERLIAQTSTSFGQYHRPSALGRVDYVPPSAYSYPERHASPFNSLRSTIFMTSINYPGVYGSYYIGPGGSMSPIVSAGGEMVGTGEAGRPAQILVRVDPDAEVWLDGSRVKGDGELRRVVTGRLEPRLAYECEIQARWTDRGADKLESKRVRVFAGDQVLVDLTPEQREDRPVARTLRAR